ncbi:MAG: AAA family ATPase [Chloroflexi bacterium]|nr:AAA family ATPase [Chloroflexota bacterium]
MTAKVVSIINLKGGVGKSTVTMILGEYLAFSDVHKRVLLIDFDSQANLTTAMVRQLYIENDLEPGGYTIYHLFKRFIEGQSASILDVICPHPEWVSNIRREPSPGRMTLDMVISTQAMASFDEEMLNMWEEPKSLVAALKRVYDRDPAAVASVTPGLGPVMQKASIMDAKSLEGIRTVLAQSLQPALDKYDAILIDCPPGLSLLTSAAIMASDYYVSPIIPEPLALQGIDLVKDRIAGLKSKTKWAGSVLNKIVANRRTHNWESDRIYGTPAGSLPAYAKAKYDPFHWWIPDSEHLRKVSDFETLLEPLTFPYLDTTGHFSYVHGKYGASEVNYSNPAGWARDRSGQEGPKYRLSGRLESLAKEFINRTGI